MNYISGAVLAGIGAYYLYEGATKPDHEGSTHAAYATREGLKSAPTSNEVAEAATLWSRNPKVMWYSNPFFTPAPIRDPTRTPPMSMRQSMANMATDPTLAGRPGGLGSSSDDTGMRQDPASSKSMEQEQSPIVQAVFQKEGKTLNETDMKRQMDGAFSKWSDNVRSGKSEENPIIGYAADGYPIATF